ncbi:MAG: AAA family ATPase, partial [Acutalibacteraceae bacterium]|nr:AAA family ATPase [Acutalibacteraceae bacterium]
MLNSLHIENIAVIENTTIDFKDGFNVITGETGAGKSIIIGSINALLGGKISKDIIRNGADFAFVSGSFTVNNKSVIEMLNCYGYDCDEEDELILQRKLNISGKSTCRINGRPATLVILKEIATHLVNIHGQHESYNLMSAEKHITYIDNIGSLSDIKKQYRENLAVLRECKRKLNSAQSDSSQRERQIDLLRYQVNEIEEVNPKEGEYEQLTEERIMVTNVQDIVKSLAKAKSILSGGDDYNGCLNSLRECSEVIDKITEYYPQTEKLSERIMTAFYDLQDCSQEISSFLESVDSDSYRIEEIEERLDLLYKLSRKYGNTTEDILEFCDKAKTELEELENY